MLHESLLFFLDLIKNYTPLFLPALVSTYSSLHALKSQAPTHLNADLHSRFSFQLELDFTPTLALALPLLLSTSNNITS